MKRVPLLATVASFVVYLIPTVGPHALSFVGGIVAGDMALMGRGRTPAWAAADVGFALALQLLALGLFVWVLRGRRWRWILVLPAAGIMIWAANLAYMVVIPTRFLLEVDTAPERITWPAACIVVDASLIRVRSGADLTLPRAGEAWIAQEPSGTYAVLRMPKCQTVPTRHQRSGTETVDYVVRGARALHRVRDTATNIETHWFDPGDGSPPIAVSKPGDKWWNPVLSADASAIAWTEFEPGGSGRRPVHRVVIRSFASGAESRFEVPDALASQGQILAFDAIAGRLLLSGGGNLLGEFDTRGESTWGPVHVEGVSSLFGTVHRLGDGWVAWDGYREEGRYRLQWSLAGGSGRHEVLKGRSINDVAVDPAGRLLAISVSNALNIGDVDDAVYVLRVEDGAEVYRRYLAPFTRTPLAFLSSKFLAFNHHEAVDRRVRSSVEVLRVSTVRALANP